MLRFSIIRAVALIAFLALMIFSAAPVSADIHVVEISNFAFTPKNTVVTPGDTVRWLMVSGTHTTTADGSSSKFWDSGVFPSGQTYDLVFTPDDGPGPFPYHCDIHSFSMKDTIFVAEGSGPVCGDANGDEQVNVGDAVSLINFVFKGGMAPDPLCSGDANGDGSTNVGDAVYLIGFVFRGGPAPVNNCCP